MRKYQQSPWTTSMIAQFMEEAHRLQDDLNTYVVLVEAWKKSPLSEIKQAMTTTKHLIGPLGFTHSKLPVPKIPTYPSERCPVLSRILAITVLCTGLRAKSNTRKIVPLELQGDYTDPKRIMVLQSELAIRQNPCVSQRGLFCFLCRATTRTKASFTTLEISLELTRKALSPAMECFNPDCDYDAHRDYRLKAVSRHPALLFRKSTAPAGVYSSAVSNSLGGGPKASFS